ncbi:hypothetical protein A9Q74_06205 [Colwellia sp. 39_35_sub15_T18]|nr:hypothetical protein A9Q74_06205 [Colwellia sp. 39_35_sub15_T18]
MAFLEPLLNFFPNLVKSLTKAFPKSDNHKLNMIFDILGFVVLIVLAGMWFDKMPKVTFEQSSQIAELLAYPFVFWFVFSLICYLTTLFKSK